MSYYPVILLPQLLQEFVAQQTKQLSLLLGKQPEPPQPPQPFTPPNIFFWAVVCCLLGGGICFLLHVLGKLMLFNLLLVQFACGFLVAAHCIYFHFAQKASESLWIQYGKQRQNYNSSMRVWRRYRSATLRLQSQTRTQRKEQLKEILTDKVVLPIGSSSAQPEVNKRLFFIKLRKYFPHLVCAGEEFSIPDSKCYYTTDFSLVDKFTGLRIDVRVDEPYSGKIKQPYHCIDREDRQEKFFLQRNWVIIRLAEEQVIRYPKACCLEIAQVLSTLTGNCEYLFKLKDVEPLPQIKRWTVAEAKNMAKKNARQGYLLAVEKKKEFVRSLD